MSQPTYNGQATWTHNEVLPEMAISEASVTEELGEEIKTQLKEMSLGFVKHPTTR